MFGRNGSVLNFLHRRELSGHRRGTATCQSRRLFQSICPTNKVQQLDVPEVHICRFSPCGQYLVCMAGGFTQLVVYRYTGPRLPPGEVPPDAGDAELASRLASFDCFFTQLYRLQLAPAGEVLARELLLFMGGGGLLLLASHSPFNLPQQQQQQQQQQQGEQLSRERAGELLLRGVATAESIHLHVVRLCDGVRLGSTRIEGEAVDLGPGAGPGGRAESLGVSTHEDLVSVLLLRSQEVLLLQLLRGGEELVAVRSVGCHVAEDDALVVRTAQRAEDSWRRQRAAEREAAAAAAAGRQSLNGSQAPQLLVPLHHGEAGPAATHGAAGAVGTAMTHGSLGPLGAGHGTPAAPAPVAPGAAHAAPLRPMRRSATGDLVLSDHLPLVTQHLAHAVQLHHASGQGGDTGLGGPGAGGLPPRPHGGGRGVEAAPLTPAVYAAGAAGAAAGAGTGGMGHGMGSGTGQQGQGAGPQVGAVLYPPAHAAAAAAATVAGGVGVGGLGAGQAGGTGLPLPAAERQALEAQHVAARLRARQRSYGQLQGLEAAPAPAGGQQQQQLNPQQQGQHGVAAPLPHVHPEQQHPQRPAVQQLASHQQQQQQLLRRGATPPGGGPGAGPHQHTQANHGGLPAGAGPPGHGQAQGNVTGPAAGAAAAAAAAAPPGAGAGPAQGRAAGAGPTIANHLSAAGAGAGEGEGPGVGGVCITGIKQRLLAYLYGTCLRAHPGHPRRQQREALVLFRHMDLYRSLVIRKAQLVDRHRLLLELRTPAAADVASSTPGAPAGPPPAPGPGVPPCQFYALYDMASTRVITMRASAEEVLDTYVRRVAGAGSEAPWTESLPLWDRFVYDNALSAARLKTGLLTHTAMGTDGKPTGPDPRSLTPLLPHVPAPHAAHAPSPSSSAPAQAPGAPAPNALSTRKILQLLPPMTARHALCPSPYLDSSLYSYDDRVISPYIRVRASLEQPISFRPRALSTPTHAAALSAAPLGAHKSTPPAPLPGFRLEPGAFEPVVVRDRRLGRHVLHLVHPDQPFVLTVFSVFTQNTLNINFRL